MKKMHCSTRAGSTYELPWLEQSCFLWVCSKALQPNAVRPVLLARKHRKEGNLEETLTIRVVASTKFTACV